MLRGFYSAAAGMLTQQKRTELLSNNIANANTPGYKADMSSNRAFPEMLLKRMENKSSVPIGSINTGVYMQQAVSQHIQGGLRETGLMTDTALIDLNVPYHQETNMKGALLFAVETGAGEERYTRNGQFTRDENGVLLSPEGHPVLATNGRPISIQTNEFQITSDGEIFAEGDYVAQIDVRFEEDVRNLVKEGNGLYRTANEQGLPSAVGNETIKYNIKQNYLENSTVDLGRTYTEMMTAYRSFEANQKILQAYDKSMDKAVNEIGRLG